MSVKSIILFAGAAMGHTMFSRSTKFGCSAPEPSEEMLQKHREFAIKEAADREAGISVQKAMSVNVYLHSVSASEDTLLSVSDLHTPCQYYFRALRLTRFA